MPASIMAIACGNLFTRNIFKEYHGARIARPKPRRKVAKLVAFAAKLGALFFVLELQTAYAIQLQLLGGIWICQTVPAVMLVGLYVRLDPRALLAGWAAGVGLGTWMVAELGFKASIYPLHLFGLTVPCYVALSALLANLVVGVLWARCCCAPRSAPICATRLWRRIICKSGAKFSPAPSSWNLRGGGELLQMAGYERLFQTTALSSTCLRADDPQSGPCPCALKSRNNFGISRPRQRRRDSVSDGTNLCRAGLVRVGDAAATGGGQHAVAHHQDRMVSRRRKGLRRLCSQDRRKWLRHQRGVHEGRGQYLPRHRSGIPGLHADCAKWVYMLRAYYASKNGLPFSYVNQIAGEGPDIRFSPASNRALSRHDLVDKGAGIPVEATLYKIHNQVWSATYRMDPEAEAPVLQDFYSPKIQPGAIHAGTAIYDINGHVGIVYDVTKDGRILYMDAHPDESVSRSFYGPQFGQSAARLGGGFKNFRPLKLAGAARQADGTYVGGRMVLAANREIADFSMEQYRGQRRERQRRWTQCPLRIQPGLAGPVRICPRRHVRRRFCLQSGL